MTSATHFSNASVLLESNGVGFFNFWTYILEKAILAVMIKINKRVPLDSTFEKPSALESDLVKNLITICNDSK